MHPLPTLVPDREYSGAFLYAPQRGPGLGGENFGDKEGFRIQAGPFWALGPYLDRGYGAWRASTAGWAVALEESKVT